jgi:ABC-2 type transport system permease protein
MQNRNAGFTFNVPVDARQRIWYDSTLESKNYVVPGLIAVMLMVISALLTSLTIAREWEMGTMEQLLSTPVRPSELVFGKMCAYFLVGALDTIIALVVGVLIFGVPFRGSLLLLAATASVFLFGALCWGIFLSAMAKQQLLAYQMGIVTSFLPSMLLSGFLYAIENMPAPIQWITHVVPARYFVTILKGIFLRGVGLEVLAVDVLFLVVFSLLVFTGATLRLRQKLA